MRSDTFNGLAYHVAEADLFLLIDYELRPQEGDFVVTNRDDGELTIERYHFQNYRGVVVFLDFYLLAGGSEQYNPTIHGKEA